MLHLTDPVKHPRCSHAAAATVGPIQKQQIGRSFTPIITF
jgi:hypothetical protein